MAKRYRRPESTEELKLKVEEGEKEVQKAQEAEAEGKKAPAVDWKKRHDDNRRYSQKKEETLQSRIEELERENSELKENAGAQDVPLDPQEREEWKKKYPKVAAVIREEAKSLLGNQEKRLKDLESKISEGEFKEKLQTEKVKLLEIHSDFPKIVVTEEFREWMENVATDSSREAISNKRVMPDGSEILLEPDARKVSDAIDLFKLWSERTEKKTKKNTEDETTDFAAEAASQVQGSSSKSPPKGGPKAKFKFKESEIAKMPSHIFMENMEAIEEAQRKGEIELDVSQPTNA